MSQNLLPFERREARRFGVPSRMWLKLMLLRMVQSRSMERADGLIFLTRYAKNTVLSKLNRHSEQAAIIPHGIEERFFKRPKSTVPLSKFSASDPFRILYVSPVDFYKHQWQVASAVGRLREEGLPVEINFVGPARPAALKHLRSTLDVVDPVGNFANYKGPVPFDELHTTYHQADAFVFASSCENLPNILLEAMAAGLPIACSNMGPMPEVLGEAGVYFDPECVAEITEALRVLVEQAELRNRLACTAHSRAKAYSWERCAIETFNYLAKNAESTRRK